MNPHNYLDHVLANYFAVDLGLSEEDAVTALKHDLSSSPELKTGLKTDVRAALDDSAFSWQRAFARHNVVTIEDEAAAKRYAVELLGWAANELA